MAELKISAEYATLLYKCAALRTERPMEKDSFAISSAIAIGLGIWSLYSGASAVKNLARGNYGEAAWDALGAIPGLGIGGKGVGIIAKGLSGAGKLSRVGGWTSRASKAIGATGAGQAAGSAFGKIGKGMSGVSRSIRRYGKQKGALPYISNFLWAGARPTTALIWGPGMALGGSALLGYGISKGIEAFGGGDKKPYELPQETGIQGQRAYTADSMQGRNISPPMLPLGVYNQQPGQVSGQGQFIGG